MIIQMKVIREKNLIFLGSDELNEIERALSPRIELKIKKDLIEMGRELGLREINY